ncbi:MAG: hypothetical protein ACHP9Z_02220 [Streptosporangiales bacterium]
MGQRERFTPPPGCVVIRVENLAALLADRAPGSTTGDRAGSNRPVQASAAATWEALAATVGLLTARLDGDAGISAADLAPDVPPAAIAAVALTIVTAWLRVLLPDEGAALLADLGLMAAARGEPPGGRE